MKVFKWMKSLSPHEYEDESLASFLGRWARKNTFDGRRQFLQATGLSVAIRVAEGDVAAIADVLSVDVDALRSISPVMTPMKPVLRRNLTRPTCEAVCPQCLAESSFYSRQIWGHALATACPTHGSQLHGSCNVCGGNFGYDRPLHSHCRCGADLRRLPMVSALPAEMEFSQLLVGQKIKVEHLPFETSLEIPSDVDWFMLRMAVHTSPVAPRRYERSSLPLTGPRTLSKTRELMNPLYRLMQDWPTRFEERFKELLQANGSATAGVAKAGQGCYQLVNRIHRHAAYQPVRTAVANTMAQHFDGTINARTRLLQSSATVEKTHFSVAEAAHELHVSADRLQDGIDSGLIVASIKDASPGYRQRFIGRQEIDRLQAIRVDHIDDAKAGALLGVTKAQFRLLREAEGIPYADLSTLPPVTSGLVVKSAIDELVLRLREVVPEVDGTAMRETVSFRELNLRKTTDRERLLSLLRDIFSGSVRPIGCEEGIGIGGLLFDREMIDLRIKSRFVDQALTLEQASQLTGIHYDALKGWVQQGLLTATRQLGAQGAPWVVQLASLTAFFMTYTPLSAVAAESGSSSRGLAANLRRAGVSVISTEGQRGMLVKVQDLVDVAARSKLMCK